MLDLVKDRLQSFTSKQRQLFICAVPCEHDTSNSHNRNTAVKPTTAVKWSDLTSYLTAIKHKLQPAGHLLWHSSKQLLTVCCYHPLSALTSFKNTFISVAYVYLIPQNYCCLPLLETSLISRGHWLKSWINTWFINKVEDCPIPYIELPQIHLFCLYWCDQWEEICSKQRKHWFQDTDSTTFTSPPASKNTKCSSAKCRVYISHYRFPG